MTSDKTKDGRKFLHFLGTEDYEKEVSESDQQKKVPRPLAQKPYPKDQQVKDLVPPDQIKLGQVPFLNVLNSRKSRRKFKEDPLSLEELSFLLWCTQGVKKQTTSFYMFRTVPSAGALHPFETYLYINHVEGLEPGLYRYLAVEHKLLFLKTIDDAVNTFTTLAYGQKYGGNCAVLFMWAAIPYRLEWRYPILPHKLIAIDLGLVTENLYLACEAENLGTVAIGYYEQKKLDKLLDLDGTDEFIVLIAPVGKYSARLSIKNFWKYPESTVTLEDKNKLVGTYTNETIPEDINLIIENNDLILRSKLIDEKLTPYNKVEFICGDFIRAIRFNLDEQDKVKSAEFLMGIRYPHIPDTVSKFLDLVFLFVLK